MKLFRNRYETPYSDNEKEVLFESREQAEHHKTYFSGHIEEVEVDVSKLQLVTLTNKKIGVRLNRRVAALRGC